MEEEGDDEVGAVDHSADHSVDHWRDEFAHYSCHAEKRRSVWPPLCPLCFWSNAFMLLPIGIAVANGLYLSATVFAIAAAGSCYYHVDECNLLGLYVDAVSVFLICANCFYMLMQVTPRISASTVMACVFFAAACMCFQIGGEYFDESGYLMVVEPEYEYYHSMWHVLSAFSGALLVHSYAMQGRTYFTTDWTEPARARFQAVRRNTTLLLSAGRPVSGVKEKKTIKNADEPQQSPVFVKPRPAQGRRVMCPPPAEEPPPVPPKRLTIRVLRPATLQYETVFTA
jgi:hypothetical protein